MLLFCMDYGSLEMFHGLSTWRGASLNFQMNYRSLKGFTQMTYIIIFYGWVFSGLLCVDVLWREVCVFSYKN